MRRRALGLCAIALLANGCIDPDRDPFYGTWRLDNDATLDRARADRRSENAIILFDGMHDDARLALAPERFEVYSSRMPDDRNSMSYRVVREEGGCRVLEFQAEVPLQARVCAIDGRLHVEDPDALGGMVMVYRRD